MSLVWLIVRRFLAFLIDWAFFCVASFPFAQLYWLGGMNEPQSAHVQTALLWGWLAYFILFEFFYGATIGKFICRLTVRRTDRTRLSFWRVFGRTLLTFVFPWGLSLLVVNGAFAINASDFAARTALSLGYAVIAFIPVSVLVFRGQSFADALLSTCVKPVSDVGTSVAPTARRWVLAGLMSILPGIVFVWGLGYGTHMMTGATKLSQVGSNFANQFPPNLVPSGTEQINERKLMLGIRGKLVRQASGRSSNADTSIYMKLYGTATSLDELSVLQRVAIDMAAQPDGKRPKCVTVVFEKDFEAVLASIRQDHEMMVCDVPTGFPDKATIVDVQTAVSLGWKVNPYFLWETLLGASGTPVPRLLPVEHKKGEQAPRKN